MAQPSILTVSDISYTYPGAPEPLLAGISANFPRGWTAVLGDNGIGKSTLMALVRGRLAPDSGTITPDPRRLVIGYCPQDVAARPENIDDFAADWSPETIAIRDELGIGDDWAYRYDTLSGGERKRLQIACVMALRPDVLILDEPTNHVDGPARDAIIAAMRRYRGIGIVVSHDVALIDATCGRCLMFERRHTGGRNVTVANAYQGNYCQASAQMAANNRSDAERLAAARREVERLEAAQAQRLVKVRQVEAAKRHGERIDPKDHDARNRRNLAKMTSLDGAAGRAYAQLDGRLAAAQQVGDGLSVAAKRYDSDIWLDIQPSGRRELIRLEPGLLLYDDEARSGAVCRVFDEAGAYGDRRELECDVTGDTVVHSHIAGENGGGVCAPAAHDMSYVDGRMDGLRYPLVHPAQSGRHMGDPTGGRGPLPLVTQLTQSGEHMRLTMPANRAGCPPIGLRIPLISIGPRDHIVISGPNGTGKSTLVRAMLAAAPEPASVPRLVIAQNTTDTDADRAVARLESLPSAGRSRVLGAYAQLNADPDRLLAGKRPSPGELRKLLLCLGLVDRPQLIVMDEPTNHLDLSSKDALARVLHDYPGALIVVSHDEWFMKRLAHTI